MSSIGAIAPGVSALGKTVFAVFCVGMEAYAVVEQDGYSAQFIYRPPIYDGPLALNASVGYKFAQVPKQEAVSSGHSKSFLIDLETLAGDRAQAEQFALAA